MLFNSLHFLIFFPIIVCSFFLLPHRYRWLLLLAASYYFYMAWKPEYVILIIISTLIDYISALAMDNYRQRGLKYKKFLIFSLISNLGLLVAFKYLNFFGESVNMVLQNFNIFYNSPTFSFLLPVGISFYTFQSLSYTIDVYRGARRPERHLGIFALYVSFFPQLVAGPIERSTRLLPQFYQKMAFSAGRISSGLRLMLWGFFKKLVIADNAALIVNSVYNNPAEHNGIVLAIATFFFAFQIYADFSGYSDIAIGSARIMGFDLMKNFDRPYLSKSIREFWRRWHISLMSWFRDYLYKPIGGSRVRLSRWVANILIVFFLSGLWHGANWTFVAWGVLNGCYLVISKFTSGLRERTVKIFKLNNFPKIHSGIQIIITFLLISFSWIFFRAASLSDAVVVIKHIFSDFWSMAPHIFEIPVMRSVYLSLTNVSLEYFIAFVAAIGIVVFVEVIQHYYDLPLKLSLKPFWIRWPVYYALILYILFFGYLGGQSFIYFAF